MVYLKNIYFLKTSWSYVYQKLSNQVSWIKKKTFQVKIKKCFNFKFNFIFRMNYKNWCLFKSTSDFKPIFTFSPFFFKFYVTFRSKLEKKSKKKLTQKKYNKEYFNLQYNLIKNISVFEKNIFYFILLR